MFGYAVLILVVVEDGLVLTLSSQTVMVWHSVLILIVVEDGLVQEKLAMIVPKPTSLNPYCSGRCPRT